MLSKEECIKSLIILQEKYINLDVLDELICFKNLIQEYFEPQPYKFEDLKVGMWVWDSFECECIKILETYITDEEDEVYVAGLKMIRVGRKYSWHDVYFEENRFYPVQMANVRCE